MCAVGSDRAKQRSHRGPYVITDGEHPPNGSASSHLIGEPSYLTAVLLLDLKHPTHSLLKPRVRPARRINNKENVSLDKSGTEAIRNRIMTIGPTSADVVVPGALLDCAADVDAG